MLKETLTARLLSLIRGDSVVKDVDARAAEVQRDSGVSRIRSSTLGFHFEKLGREHGDKSVLPKPDLADALNAVNSLNSESFSQ